MQTFISLHTSCHSCGARMSYEGPDGTEALKLLFEQHRDCGVVVDTLRAPYRQPAIIAVQPLAVRLDEVR